MTDTNVSLFDDLRNMLEQSEPDFLRRAVAMLFQQIMDADVTQRVGATRHQRSGVRRNYRNGFRQRRLDTRVGTIELQIPKLRAETYFPPFLTHRKRSEAALIRRRATSVCAWHKHAQNRSTGETARRRKSRQKHGVADVFVTRRTYSVLPGA